MTVNKNTSIDYNSIDYAKTVDALYVYLEKEMKKMFREERFYSEVFYQIYKTSKRAYKEDPFICLSVKDKTVISGELENLATVIEKLMAKRDIHEHSWALLFDLLKSKIKEIREENELNVESFYFTMMNLWACLENWEPKKLKAVFPVMRSVIRVQDKWIPDEETYSSISTCIYKCFGEREFYGFVEK